MASKKKAKIERRGDQIEEIKLCGKEPIHFIKKYVRISHPTRGPIPFKTYPYQEECVQDFQEHRLVICNKSRQLGLSTVSAAYSLWMALFRREKNILVIATKLETAKLFLRKVKGMFDSLPEWLVMPQLIGESVKELKFSNGSVIKAIPTSPDAGRGEAVSLLIVDEAAHIDGFDDLWTGLQPMLSTGGSCILISSPLGVGNQFYNIWKMATDTEGPNGEKKEGSNGFWAIELPWTVHPEHDEAWFESQCKNLLYNNRAIAQELLCSFESSGYQFLDKETTVYLHSVIETPVARYKDNLDMNIWEYPINEHKYIISADVARGDAEDYSAFHVIDVSTKPCRVAAEYKGRIEPDKFAEFLIEVAKHYNNAFIVHEKNAAGLVTSFKLRDSKYPYLYYSHLFDNNLFREVQEHETIEKHPGFTTSPKTRPEIMAKLEAALRNKDILVRSSRLIEEFLTFVIQNDKPKALKNCNDDLIMSLAIGCAFIEYGNTVKEVEQNPMALINAMSRSSNILPHTIPQGSGIGTAAYDLPILQGSDTPKDRLQRGIWENNVYGWLFRD